MRSIVLFVVIFTAVIVVINARSLGRSVQLDEIPVKVIYDTEPLETVYTKVIVKGMVEPNENDEKQLDNKYEVLAAPEEVLAVVEEVTKEENENQETIPPKDEEILQPVFPQSDVLQVPVNIIPQSDLEVIVQPLTNKPAHKESTITEVVVNVDGFEIKKDEQKIEISQELLPPLVKPTDVIEEERNEDKQNELSEIEQNNNINTENKKESELSTTSEQQDVSEQNNLEHVVAEDKKKKDSDEILYTLRFSESHPAQVPTKKASGVVKEENKIDSEESSTEAASTTIAAATVKPDRPKPFVSLQNTISNIIQTVRPANVVQAIVNRNKGNNNDNNKKDSIKEPEKATVVEENVSNPPKLEENVTPSSPISNFQIAFNNQVDNFRETVNNAMNNLRPTPKPGAEGDSAPNRPFIDALQSTFNNGVNTLSNTVNNAISTFAPQSNDQSIPQQLQNVIQNSLNQFGQSVSSALNLRPRPDSESSDETQTGQNMAQVIQNALNTFVENINNFNKRPDDESTQNDQVTNPQSQGPFAIALNGLQNFISNFRPSEKPLEAEGTGEGNNNQPNRPNPLQIIQSAGQSINNFISNLRPTQKPSTDNKVVPEENVNSTADKNQNTENSENPQDAANDIKPEKNSKGN